MNSDNAQTIHQVASDLHRQQQRERRSLSRRLQEAITRATMLSTVSSHSGSDTGKIRHLKPEDRMPAGIGFDKNDELVTHVDTFNLRGYLAPIEQLISVLEAAVDRELGLGQGKHHATKTGEELDEEIRLWRGTLAHVVSVRAPWLGSPRTIERRRLAMGLRPSNGLELEDRAA